MKAVVGPDAFSRDEATQPDSHAYIEAGFLRPEPLQNYIDLVREEARQTWAKLAARDEFDLFPEVSHFEVDTSQHSNTDTCHPDLAFHRTQQYFMLYWQADLRAVRGQVCAGLLRH